jgi:SAM-dependent methyltransferase
MSTFENDPIGHAIQDFANQSHDDNIIVKSSICDDDVIPVAYLFRSESELPELEKLALKQCLGKILDVGGGAGIHAAILKNNGHAVQIIDTSQGAVNYHQSKELESRCVNFYDLKNEKFDTLLFLMNGFGIAESMENLPIFLQKCYGLLEDGGQIIGDSTDIKYLYEDEEGGYWMDLNSAYYGDFDFQMTYKETIGAPFNWLYVDFETLKSVAEKTGFNVEKLFEEDNQFLVRLKKNVLQ